VLLVSVAIVLVGCASAPDRSVGMRQARSQWIPAAWEALPGWEQDGLDEAWLAWVAGCARPPQEWVALCPAVRSLLLAPPAAKREWMQKNLQPYAVRSHQGDAAGELTGYFEPAMVASRTPTASFSVPLYRPPAGLGQRKPWYTRKEMDTDAAAQAALSGKAIAYLVHPVDAMILQIQGSARLQLQNPDGSTTGVRLSYAGSNDQPYRSPGRWLLDQGLVRDASWAGIKTWLAQNPDRRQELLWSNPRVVFFRDEPLKPDAFLSGPQGAQGVPLTAGRSIAVDPGSIPLGTPVWLSSEGAHSKMERLVLAQDTGNAISGAVRADYFVGSGEAASASAGRLKQGLKLWALWPKLAGSR
jgi:membrane-bound lytic murein transglycosylase A